MPHGAIYQRTTIAVADQIRRGGFAGPGWVGRWDVSFAELAATGFGVRLPG